MELLRGKSAKVIEALATFLISCKGLRPSFHNRDLQEGEKPAFDSVKATVGMLEISAVFTHNISFNKECVSNALPGHLDATTLVDYLIKKGVPFPHDTLTRLVAFWVSKNCRLKDLIPNTKVLLSTHFLIRTCMSTLALGMHKVKNFRSYGSTGSGSLASKMDYWVRKLNVERI